VTVDEDRRADVDSHHSELLADLRIRLLSHLDIPAPSSQARIDVRRSSSESLPSPGLDVASHVGLVHADCLAGSPT
jgi:hypothetical protein